MEPGKEHVPYDSPFPLFPLRELVVFPHTVKPFLFYEPRYLRMMREVLDGFGLLVTARFRVPPSRAESLWGRPALLPVASLCQVQDYERTPEGFYNVILYGIRRVKILDELPPKDYRRVRVRPFDTALEGEKPLAAYRKVIDGLLKRFLARNGQTGYPVIGHRLPTGILIDQLIDAVCSNTAQRYAMLRESNVHRRAAWLIRCLRETVGDY